MTKPTWFNWIAVAAIVLGPVPASVSAPPLVPTDANAYYDKSGNWTGSRFDGPAELPRAGYHTNLADTPSPGQLRALKATDDLFAALKAAKCGDTITLQAGANYPLSSSASFPAKNCDDQHYITVRTSAPNSSLPPEHKRINPSYADVALLPGRPAFRGGSGNVMAKITYSGSGLATGDHYRLIGLEITRPSDGKPYVALFSLTGTSKVVFDRCWLHGDPVAETRRGVWITGATTHHIAVIDSYLNDFHCTAVTGTCTDAQAIAGADGFSVVKLVNNFLEASGENILFGGATATANDTDVEIRLNHFFKPMIWNPTDPSYFGHKFAVKNLFELKQSERVLFEGNVLENNWVQAQAGWAVLLTPKSQGGICPICADNNITMRYSLIRRVPGVLSVINTPSDNGSWSQGMKNISIHDVVADGLQYPTCNGCGNPALANEFGNNYTSTNPPPTVSANVSINHVTLVNMPWLVTGYGASAFMELAGPPANNPTNTPRLSNWQVINSIVGAGNNGIVSTGGGTNNCASVATNTGHNTPAEKLSFCFASSTFAGNIFADYSGKPTVWPSGNIVLQDWNSVGFVDFRGGVEGDYHLRSTSPHKNKAFDGKDPGADVDAIDTVIDLVQ